MHRLRRHTLVPLRVWRYQRYRNAIDKNVSSAHLPAIDLEIIGRVASGVIAHATHESCYQGNKLNWVANRARDLQGKVVHQGVLHGRTNI